MGLMCATTISAGRWIAVVLCVLTLRSVCAVTFKDVSKSAGLIRRYGRRLKYGGPCVADLDGDGYQDLIFGHHNDRYTDLYFNQGDGTFKRASWQVWADTHGINAFRRLPWEKNMHFTLSRGGSNGMNPRAPDVYSIRNGRRVVDVTAGSGLRRSAGRGRSAVFLRLRRPLRASLGPDLVVTNVFDVARSGNYHHGFSFSARSGRWAYRKIGPFTNELNPYVTVADVDGDGLVELVSFYELRVYRVASNFRLTDVTARVLPAGNRGDDLPGVVGVAELDFDNDGKWDLYVARTNTGDMSWLRYKELNDRLFRNVGGRYVDVSRAAGIPRNIQSRGVSAGDFNNDGWVDLLVTQYYGPDLLLLNNGDGTFRRRNAGFRRGGNVRGDMGVAVDLDRDGRLDVALSEGDWQNKKNGGYYRIMKNVSRNLGNYLLVRVKSSPSNKATSLHAVAVVKLAGRRGSMRRRVGSQGTVISNSYIELLHFGLGSRKRAASVTITWVDGTKVTKRNVAANSLITVGR